jgi:hypothetical protein
LQLRRRSLFRVVEHHTAAFGADFGRDVNHVRLRVLLVLVQLCKQDELIVRAEFARRCWRTHQQQADRVVLTFAVGASTPDADNTVKPLMTSGGL